MAPPRVARRAAGRPAACNAEACQAYAAGMRHGPRGRIAAPTRRGDAVGFHGRAGDATVSRLIPFGIRADAAGARPADKNPFRPGG